MVLKRGGICLWLRKKISLLFAVILLFGSFADFVSIGHAESTADQAQAQNKKNDDVTVLQEKSDMASEGLSPNEVVVANGKKGSNLFDFEAFIKPSDIVDGTAPFDSNDEAGNDSSPNNGIVRTFDTVTYPLKVTINPKKKETLKNIKMKITGTLENGITNKRVNAKFAVGGKEDLEKGIVSFEMEYTLKETGNSLMIPVTVEVQGAEHGLKLKPNIKIQIISVDGKDIVNENVSQSFDDIRPVTTSGKVNVKARLTNGYLGVGINKLRYAAYNKNLEKGDNSEIFPVVLDLFITNLPNRNDLRGATFPSGKINYHLDFSGKVVWDQSSIEDRILNFEGEDTPIKIFNYQAVDSVKTKIPQKNTESFELGLANYIDNYTIYSPSPISYIPKEKWNASDIGNYTINSVWDSGINNLEKPEISKNKVSYKGSISDYLIGSTFPTGMSHTRDYPSFRKNEKGFSSTRFLIHTPNEYAPLNKNNMVNKHNNVYYEVKVTVDSYEDSSGNIIPYNNTGKTTLIDRNNPAGSYSLQTTFHSQDGKELGTPYAGYSVVSKGDPTVILGQDVRMVAHLNVRRITDGGATVIYKWNSDSFYLTKEGSKAAIQEIFKRGYMNPLGERIRNSENQKVFFGIAKKKDNSFESLTQNQVEDYDWYNTYDEARKHGEVAAIQQDVNVAIGNGEIGATNIRLAVKTKKIGSVNEQGTPNIIVTAADVYPTADRKTRYRVRSDGKYINYTEYDEFGKLTKIQSPVGSTVNFETLGIINSEVSSEIKTNKTTYYSSDNVKITVDNLIKLPDTTDFSSLYEKVEMRVKLPKGLDYVPGTGTYGDKGIEPKLEVHDDGTSYLIWYDILTKGNPNLKKVNFEAKINPVLLPPGNQTGLTIENTIISPSDTRSEKFRTSSKNISIVKIGMVGVSETIKNTIGKRNSDYEIGIQPYTTIQDESQIKALTHVPRNKDENGSLFSGITFLKQVTLENPNNKKVEIWLNNNYIESNNPNKIDLNSKGWYKYSGNQDLSKVTSILLYVNDSLSSSDVVKMNLVFGTQGNEFGDRYVSSTVVNTAVDYKLSPISNKVRYTIMADATIGLKKIRIYTAPFDSENGLPVTVNVDKEITYSDSDKELVSIQLYDKEDKILVDSKSFTIKELPDEISFKVDSKYLKKNTKKNYEAKIEKFNKYSMKVLEGSIDTDGYTSSEEVVKVSSQNSDKLEYKGVVMTQRESGMEMEKYYETLTIPLKPLPKQKTGYGYDLTTKASYTNELGTTTDIKAQSVIDKALIDTYLNYEQKDGKTVVPLENTKKTIDQKTTDFIFELPHVNVEEKTGALFTDKQVESKDSHIKFKLKDGKRKLYIPIWANLGNYDIQVNSIEPIGVNKVQFRIAHNMNVYAYMYGTIGSKTIKEDELLLEPVDPNNPFPNGKPNGWSDEDVAWLKR
ncbi:fusion protein (includes pXO2-28-29-30) (plasmid) [Bacillus cytotoxicus]|nr:fusion protein (includes pXO2-28-29-30) [Bacillus cytotoxicus]AWC43084.1 fusion protein (includes pXO2-28-29-30) [Bacillus cytotoxicus]AWC51015.1 fusion protein (includes pXO2-28-29-30) [Bacillus cytotoxicus]AWC55131.1 fusion protein (includes pXO2-28-29-30) [Bacillus cytotoxicus]AWC59280.1 fusion protein (includes pXO2-28-29-30) [Bacillus cytotoxicus]